MQNLFIEYFYLVLIILALLMIANKLRLAYPIVLVLGGLALSFTAMFSKITIDPEIVFYIFLPPLLYEAAWQVSWKEFWKLRHVIISFAFPIVITIETIPSMSSRRDFSLWGVYFFIDMPSLKGLHTKLILKHNSRPIRDEIFIERLKSTNDKSPIGTT